MPFAVEVRVLSAESILVDHAEIADVEKGRVRGPPAKVRVLRPAALRIIFPAQGKVGGAVDRPKVAIPDDRTLARGAPKVGNEEPGLVRFFRQGVSGKREIEYGHAVDPETAVVNAGLAGNLDGDSYRMKRPFGSRQFAGCYRAVVDHESSGPAFLH